MATSLKDKLDKLAKQNDAYYRAWLLAWVKKWKMHYQEDPTHD